MEFDSSSSTVTCRDFYVFLTREMRVSRGGAVVSALGFMFSGFIVVWMAYGTLSMAVAFLPLILLSLEKFLRKNKIRFLIPAALAVTVSLFQVIFRPVCMFSLHHLSLLSIAMPLTEDLKE